MWVSTYTKALQRQLRRESARAWPARRADGAQPVVVRKGRENYLCLLNLEDALQGGFGGRAAILAQLVARWAAYSQDGDMIGGDLPGWLRHAVPPARGHRADRPARRMRLCRLPALPQMLHRARRPRQCAGRSGHRQPRAGDGQRRARPRSRPAPDPDRVRRGPPCVRGRRFDVRCRADRGRDDRAAPLGDRARSAGQRAAVGAWPPGSPISPAMTRRAARRSPRRARRPMPCPATAGCNGLAKARRRAARRPARGGPRAGLRPRRKRRAGRGIRA